MMCGVLEFPVLDPCSVSCFFGLCHSSQGDCLQPLCTAVPYPSSLERPSGHSGGLQRPPGDPRTRRQQLYQACGLLVPPLTLPFALRVGLGGNAAACCREGPLSCRGGAAAIQAALVGLLHTQACSVSCSCRCRPRPQPQNWGALMHSQVALERRLAPDLAVRWYHVCHVSQVLLYTAHCCSPCLLLAAHGSRWGLKQPWHSTPTQSPFPWNLAPAFGTSPSPIPCCPGWGGLSTCGRPWS